jgi:RNA polymerase sigma factor for flagellar operon FliA
MPLVDVVAQRIGRKLRGQLPVDEMRAIGRSALLDAARSFDPDRACFDAYVTKKVAWAIYDGVRRETHGRAVVARGATSSELCLREGAGTEWGDARDADDVAASSATEPSAIPASARLPYADDLGAHEAHDPEARLSREQADAELHRAVAQLPARERALVTRHYFAGEAFDAIAQDLGISKSWASRLHAQAIRALAERLRDAG